MSQPKLTSLFRIQTLLMLHPKHSKSGYDLAKELEQLTGKKPSSGKIYPFLHELKDTGYIIEKETGDSGGRSKFEYFLTEKGVELKEELAERMANLLQIRLDQKLDKCHHCGVKLYDSIVEGKDKSGSPVVFCCKHCQAAYFDK